MNEPLPPPFCGRERDLDRLHEAWRAVAEGGGPRLVVLLAESGLGKTRLVQEFYARLAADHRSPEGEGYWPPRLGRNDQNLVVNPDLAAVDGAQVMPFLWWALRLVDPEGRNRVLSGAVATYLKALTPHLQPMYRAQRQKRRWLEGGRVVGGAALGFIPLLGGLVDLGKAAFELEQLRREVRADRALSPEEAERQAGSDLTARIVGDLEQLFRGGHGEAAIPMVWVVDDAHFSPADPGLTALFERVLAAAQEHGWPLLIVVTHWEREWHAQRVGEGGSVAAVIERSYRPPNPDWRPTALTPLAGDELAPALAAQLPGLSAAQRARLLERAGGNPRFLDEVVRLCLGRARYFEGRDPTGPLTDRGLADVLAASTSLHDLVEKRFRDAPEAVRTLVSLSSLQGVRLLYLVSRGVLDRLRVHGHALQAERPREALELARTPYAFLNLLDGQLAEFSQQVFFEVAREGIEDLVDAEQADRALIEALRALHEGGAAEVAELSDEEQSLLLELAAEVLARSHEADDRQLALSALAQLAGRTFLGGDHRTGAELAERAREGAEAERWRLDALPASELQGLSIALQIMGRLDGAAELAQLARAAAEASGDRPDLVNALTHLAGVERDRGDLDAALASAHAALALARDLAASEGGAARTMLAYPIYTLATRLRDAGDPARALTLYREGRALARELVDDGVRDAGWLAGNFERCIGMALAELGESEGALAAHREGLATFEALFAASPSPSLRRDLWLARQFIGNLHLERDELAEAEQSHRVALALGRALAEEQTSPDATTELGASHGRLGDVALAQGRLDSASASYRASLEVAREQVESVGGPLSLGALADAFDRVAALAARRDAWPEALAASTEALAVRCGSAELLAPAEAALDEGAALIRLGEIEQGGGDLEAALGSYREAIGLLTSAVGAGRRPEAQRELAVASRAAADLLLAREEREGALPLLVRGLEAARTARAQLPAEGADLDEAIAWFRERLGGAAPS